MKIRRSAKVAAVGAAVVGLGLSAGPALAATSGSGSTWTVTGTAATVLADATSLGAAPAATSVPVTVTLATRNASGLDALIADQSNPASASYHRYLTPAEYKADFGATPAQITAVSSYLRSQGLTHLVVSANRQTISAQATGASAERAFGTQLGLFRQAGRDVVANTTPARVPARLTGIVEGVVGLNQAAAVAPLGLDHAGLLPTGGTSFNPPAFPKIYDASSLPAATGTSMAIMAEGNLTQVKTDLRTEEAANHLPAVTVKIVPTGKASSDTSGLDEWDLDSQTSTAMAGNVKVLYLYDAPSLTDPSIVTEISDFVAQDLAVAGSASFGECDSDAQADGTAKAVDAALKEAVAQGQTFFASSGDSGSSCSTSLEGLVPGPTETSYPASGTYTTAVGGTTLNATSSDTYGSETAWDGSGGGLSTEPAPSWQAADVAAAKAAAGSSGSSGGGLLGGLLGSSGSPTGNRGVPDIAMDADPNTGANIVVDGQTETVGGTSLASPLALGAWTRIQQAHGDRLGDAAPDLYAHTTGIHDITSGSNGAYSAGPGYDFVTGLGSLDVAKVSASL